MSELNGSPNPEESSQSFMTAVGSGFYDRTELLEEHRRQRDRLRRHLQQAEHRDKMQVAETSLEALSANVRPFFEQAGLGVPGEEPGPNSRPWTQDGRPISGSVEMPAVMENFDDPYDAGLAATMHQSGYFAPAPATEGGKSPSPCETQQLAPGEDKLSADARGALNAINALLADAEAQSASSDMLENAAVLRDLESRIDSLSRVQTHLEHFSTRNASVDAVLSKMLRERETEVGIIGDTMEHLGGRRDEELVLYRWDQELRRREARHRDMLSLRQRNVREIGVNTIPLLDEDMDRFVHASTSAHTDADRKRSVAFAPALSSDAHDDADTEGEFPVIARRDSTASALSESGADKKPEKKGTKGLRVARAIGMLNAKSKVKRSNSPTDELMKAKSQSILRPTEAGSNELDHNSFQIPEVAAPRQRVVLVHMYMSYNEIMDAVERETTAFMAATFSVMQLIVASCERFKGYPTRMTRTAFTVAFSSDTDALHFIMHVQTALIDGIEWPLPLLRFRGTAPVEDPKLEGRVLFRGLRLSAGIHAANIESKVPWRIRAEADPLSGRVSYMGPEALVAVQLAELARGGEIFVATPAWESIKQHAPFATFTAVSTKEISLRLTPEEARRSALALYVTGVNEEGFCLVNVTTIANLEQQNRRILLGPHPREVLAQSGMDESALLPSADELGSPKASATTLRSPEQRNPSRGGLMSAPGAGGFHDVSARQGLNVKPLRATADNTHATFVVICVPDFAQILALPGGQVTLDSLRNIMQRCMDSIVSVKQLFNKAFGAVQRAPGLDSFPAGGFVAQTFDETVAMFKSETLACQFALAVQDEVRAYDWPTSIVDFYRRMCGEPDDCEHWRGLRVAAGIAASAPTVVPHRSTGLLTYEGLGLMIARELAHTARGGQCLMPHRIVEVIKLKGVLKYDFVVECINPQKSTKETQVFALYSKAFADRHDEVKLRQDMLVKLLRNLHEIRIEAANPGGRKVTVASLGTTKRTDAFLAAAEKMCTTHLQFDMVLRAVHSGAIDDKAADVMLNLLKNAEKQGSLDKKILDETEPPAELSRRADSDTDDDHGAQQVYSPYLAAQEIHPLPHAPGIKKKLKQCSVQVVHESGARDVNTQTPWIAAITGALPNIVTRTPGSQAISAGAASAGGSHDSQSGSESDDGPEEAAGMGASKSRRRKRRKPQVQVRQFKTQAELLEEKENKWKALHRVIQDRREKITHVNPDAASTAADAVLRRREAQIQALLERKAKEEARRERKKEAWRKRQEERKDALRAVIKQRLEDFVAQAERVRDNENQPRWKLAIKGDVDEQDPRAGATSPHGDAARPDARPSIHPAPPEGGTPPAAARPRAHHEPPSDRRASTYSAGQDADAPHRGLEAPPQAADETASSPVSSAAIPPRGVIAPVLPRIASAPGSSGTVTTAVCVADAKAQVNVPTTGNPSAQEIPMPAGQAERSQMADADVAQLVHAGQLAEPAAAHVTATVTERRLAVDLQPSQRNVGRQTHEHRTVEMPDTAAVAQALTATALAGNAAFQLDTNQAAEDLARVAVDEMSLSSIASSVLSILAEDDDIGSEADSLDAGSDVEDLLAAAGIQSSPRHQKAAKDLTRAEREDQKFAREARKLIAEAQRADDRKRLIPTASRGIQCDLGPRVIVRKEKVVASPRGTAATVINFASNSSPQRKGAPAPADEEHARRYDASEDMDVVDAPPSSLPTSPRSVMRGTKKKMPAPVNQREVAASDADLAIERLLPRSQVEMHSESSRRHAVDDDEELSFVTHLVQRRDVIADFSHSVDILAEEVRTFRDKGALQFVPTLARKAQRQVLHPLRHYLEQLCSQSEGSQLVHSEEMLSDVKKCIATEDHRRTADAALKWRIAFTRWTIERRSQRALSAATPQGRRAQLAVVAALLKKLATLKELHRGEREARIASLQQTLESLFATRLEAIPQVPDAVELKPYVPADAAEKSHTNATHSEQRDSKIASAKSTTQARPNRKANAAALRAAGVKNVKADVLDPGTFAMLQQTLLEFDPALTEMPNTLNPDFDPLILQRPVTPPAPAIPSRPREGLAPIADAGTGAAPDDDRVAAEHADPMDRRPAAVPMAPSPPREAARTRQTDQAVGRADSSEVEKRRMLLQLDFQLEQSRTRDAAHGIDSVAPPVRMQLPQIPGARNHGTDAPAKADYDTWLNDLNSRIHSHRDHIMHKRCVSEPEDEAGAKVPAAGASPRTTDPRMHAQSARVNPNSGLPPVRSGRKGPAGAGGHGSPGPARKWM